MSDYPPRTGAEDGPPVTLGPVELADLWKRVLPFFALPSGAILTGEKRSIEVSVWKSRTNKTLIVSDMAELLKPGELQGLLDDVEILLEIEFKSAGSEKKDTRALKLKFWALEPPRVWITGETNWAASLDRELKLIFAAYPNNARAKHYAVALGAYSGAFAYFLRETTSPIGEWFAVLLSAVFSAFAFFFIFMFTDRQFPVCRVFADSATGHEPVLYKYAGSVAWVLVGAIASWAVGTYLL